MLIVTGIVNAGYRGFTRANVFMPAPWQSPFGHVFALKLSAFEAMRLVSGVRDIVVGHRAMAVRGAPG